jgi:hypothetical protein
MERFVNNKILIHYIFFIKKFYKNNKARQKMNGLCYMDGLVSTGNKFPYTILKIIFAIRKEIILFFINILKRVVDKVPLYFKNYFVSSCVFRICALLLFFKDK